ncbi:hypothetical protein [Nocardia huaxiensis]|uniref:Uncharacterized protein n=1 Tax=Nocardia huaxiensis TaxID=2755382 RepID=A0A7D6Z021_9NOCA|nr:hypothetical protein [Nocardia huaxiensis]QLY29026.1 hypothetical protein H0264_27435 [Nocardia huaxiensis]UFS97490.1 hypothetical protein LPY97_06170 [Nocardia huaxiensis]
MSTHSAVVDEVEISPADAGNGVPTGFFERIAAGVAAIRRNGSEITLPAKVRETQYAVLATTGFAFVHCLLALAGGLDAAFGSIAHFFAAWVSGAAALVFGMRSRWVWLAALGLASVQTFLGILTLVSAEMPTGVGPFTVLFGVMASGIVLALLLRRDCYSWFAPA